MLVARVVLFALVSIACWELIRFLGKVVFEGLETGSIRHTNAKSTASRSEGPLAFWMLVLVFLAMCAMTALAWTGILFDIAERIAGHGPGVAYSHVGRVVLLCAVCPLPLVVGFSTAKELFTGLRTGVIEAKGAPVSKQENPALYWRSLAVSLLLALLCSLLVLGMALEVLWPGRF